MSGRRTAEGDGAATVIHLRRTLSGPWLKPWRRQPMGI